MQLGGKPQRVRLKTGLTKYDKRLKEGILGFTIPDQKLSVWGSQDRFVAVAFDNGINRDVLYKSLEIITNCDKKEKNLNSKGEPLCHNLGKRRHKGNVGFISETKQSKEREPFDWI